MAKRDSSVKGWRCDSRRVLSGVNTKCKLRIDHQGPHHAETMTGAPRYWATGVPGDFATLTDMHLAIDEKNAKSVKTPPVMPPELFELDPAEFKVPASSKRSRTHRLD